MKTSTKYYAIEVIGYGKKTRYAIKIVNNGIVSPLACNIFRTEEHARIAADKLGIKIEKIGDAYQIV